MMSVFSRGRRSALRHSHAPCQPSSLRHLVALLGLLGVEVLAFWLFMQTAPGGFLDLSPAQMQRVVAWGIVIIGGGGLLYVSVVLRGEAVRERRATQRAHYTACEAEHAVATLIVDIERTLLPLGQRDIYDAIARAYADFRTRREGDPTVKGHNREAWVRMTVRYQYYERKLRSLAALTQGETR